MTTTAFRLVQPKERDTCVVFSSPHSGRDYPWTFLCRSLLDETSVRSSEDAFVDLLFSDAPAFGAPLLAATAPRAFVDLNRSIDELDPALIEGVPRGGHNPRIVSGLGVIPRVVSGGRVIQTGKMSRAEADKRLNDHWVPFHRQLQGLLDESRALFGRAILFDCHSMPHDAVSSVGKSGQKRPEIVIGDRYGASANSEIVDQLETLFRNEGFVVARNTPFAGAYITQHYGRPSRGQHAIQIEIDRALYMDEKSIRPSRHFKGFRDVMRRIVIQMADIGRDQGRESMPLAAE